MFDEIDDDYDYDYEIIRHDTCSNIHCNLCHQESLMSDKEQKLFQVCLTCHEERESPLDIDGFSRYLSMLMTGHLQLKCLQCGGLCDLQIKEVN